MGYYINGIGVSFNDKVHSLKTKHNGKVVDTPAELVNNLVCVVNNGFFAAAAYIKNQKEFKDFTDSNDIRPKTWLIVPDAGALID